MTRCVRASQAVRLVATRGVAALPMVQQAALYLSIQAYDAFTEDNDPHGEHDFGAVNFDGELYLWKIDYLRQ